MERRCIGRGSGARLNLPIVATGPRWPRRWLTPGRWYRTPEGHAMFAAGPADVQVVVGFEDHTRTRHPGRCRYGFVYPDGTILWDPPTAGWPSCSVDQLVPVAAMLRCPLCCAVACLDCGPQHTADCPDRGNFP